VRVAAHLSATSLSASAHSLGKISPLASPARYHAHPRVLATVIPVAVVPCHVDLRRRSCTAARCATAMLRASRSPTRRLSSAACRACVACCVESSPHAGIAIAPLPLGTLASRPPPRSDTRVWTSTAQTSRLPSHAVGVRLVYNMCTRAHSGILRMCPCVGPPSVHFVPVERTAIKAPLMPPPLLLSAR
jgi:hypothetical protein